MNARDIARNDFIYAPEDVALETQVPRPVLRVSRMKPHARIYRVPNLQQWRGVPRWHIKIGVRLSLVNPHRAAVLRHKYGVWATVPLVHYGIRPNTGG
jgi:hypothetical protein